MFNLVFRLNNSSSIYPEKPDPPIINRKGVSVIDWNLSDSDAVNKYVNRLIQLSLTRYFESKDEENKKRTEDGRPAKRARLSYLEDELDEPLVSIFDSFVTFQETRSTVELSKVNDPEFKKKHKILNLIDKLTEADGLLFYISLRNYFTNSLFNVIKNRLLVVIYINEFYFDKFLFFILKKEFYFHLVIVTTHNQLPIVLRKNFTFFKSLDHLQITNSPSEPNCLEIKTYDKTKYKNIKNLVRI